MTSARVCPEFVQITVRVFSTISRGSDPLLDVKGTVGHHGSSVILPSRIDSLHPSNDSQHRGVIGELRIRLNTRPSKIGSNGSVRIN